MRYSRMISRRGFCTCGLALGVTGRWLGPAEAYVEARDLVDLIRDAAATAPLVTHKLRGDVAVIEGSGGNIAVLSGPDGKVFIDAGITATRPRIMEAVNSLGNDPIRHLINTHWHFDHTDGNQWLNAEGAAILSHVNTHKRLLSAIRVEDWEFNFRFSEADIFHCGDTYWNRIYPFIDYSTGGSIDGTIKAAEANLAAVTDKTIVIPGHNLPDLASPVSNKAELSSFRDMLVAIRESVAKLKRDGRSLDETVAAKPTLAFDAQWGQFLISPALFTKLVYEGV
jgi:glyoxylase-like metal-dependent hydrolase (beta-lactamase superfamily II)